MKSYDKTSFIMNSFLIFEFPPLSYKYHLEINCETFGKTKDAEINQGFLFVMFENSDIQIFSLERILTEFGRKGSQFSDISEVNVDITEKPAVLFSVKHMRAGAQSFIAVYRCDLQVTFSDQSCNTHYTAL